MGCLMKCLNESYLSFSSLRIRIVDVNQYLFRKCGSSSVRAGWKFSTFRSFGELCLTPDFTVSLRSSALLTPITRKSLFTALQLGLLESKKLFSSFGVIVWGFCVLNSTKFLCEVILM